MTIGEDGWTCGGTEVSRSTVGVQACGLGCGGVYIRSIVGDDGLTDGRLVTSITTFGVCGRMI